MCGVSSMNQPANPEMLGLQPVAGSAAQLDASKLTPAGKPSDSAYRPKQSPVPELSFSLNARTVVGVAAPSACKAIGNYWAFAQIAAGGMATVHVGYGFSNGKRRTVAIKLLKPMYVEDEEFVTMFTSEARLAARIQHPNVVQTLDFVTQDDELALVMDYVPGEALSKLLVSGYREGNPASPPILRRILADVLRGLHAAHEARDADGNKALIVHRDVSPQNILVGVDGVARVLDFGIAQAAGRASFTRDNEVRGKLSYVAPEQLEEGPVDLRADVYSAAVVLWEALTCKRLFQTDDEATTLSRVLNLRVPPPSHYNKQVSPELDAIVLKGLSRDRELRYQSAWDMARAVAASGPCATRDEVADWVNAVASQKLSERQRLVAAMHGAAINQPNEFPKQYPTRCAAVTGQNVTAHGSSGARSEGVPWSDKPLTDTQPNDTQLNDTQLNEAHSNELQSSAPNSSAPSAHSKFRSSPTASAAARGPLGAESSFADLPMVSDAHLSLPPRSLRWRRRLNNTLLAAGTLFGGAVLGTTLVLQGANFLEPRAAAPLFAARESNAAHFVNHEAGNDDLAAKTLPSAAHQAAAIVREVSATTLTAMPMPDPDLIPARPSEGSKPPLPVDPSRSKQTLLPAPEPAAPPLAVIGTTKTPNASSSAVPDKTSRVASVAGGDERAAVHPKAEPPRVSASEPPLIGRETGALAMRPSLLPTSSTKNTALTATDARPPSTPENKPTLGATQPSSSAQSAEPKTKTAAAPTASAQPRPQSCEPPYTIDLSGIRRYKLECL